MNRELSIALLVIAAGVYFLVGYQTGSNLEDGKETTSTETASKDKKKSDKPDNSVQGKDRAGDQDRRGGQGNQGNQGNDIARGGAERTPPPRTPPPPTPPPALQSLPPAPAVAPTQTSPASDTVWRVIVNDSDAFWGAADAPVTMVVFSAYGHETARAFSPAIKQVQEKYGKQVRVVMKHKLLPPSPYALEASIAALAAKEQGKFWEMQEKLFENSPAFDSGSLERYAKEVGLNVNKFKKDIALDRLRGQVMKDTLLANEVGAHSMPNILVNGVRLRGEKNYDNVVALLDQQLSKAQAAIKGGIPAKDYYGKTVASGKNFQQLEPSKFRFTSNTSAVLGKPDAKIEIAVFEDFQ